VFEDEGQNFVSDSMLYSFETEKGKIYRAKTQEGEGYLHGEQIKMISQDELYVKGGKYTTCQHDTPHFYIHAQKLKVVKNNKIVTGPANLKIDGAPTPLVLPFGMFPAKSGQSSGIVLPQQYGGSPTQGLFLNRIGYYWALSEYFDLENTWDVYSLGSWASYLNSNYKKRYRYTGSLGIDFSVFKTGFKELSANTVNTGFPYFSKVTNFFVRWNHTQDPKANPKWRFSSEVNAGTGSNYRDNAECSPYSKCN